MDSKIVNIEEIMQGIRREIQEKGLTSDMLDFEDVPYRKAEDPVNGCSADSEEVKQAMIYLNGHYNIQPYKPLGGNPLFVFVKKVIRKLTKFYVEPIVFDQNAFNANVVRILNAMRTEEPADASGTPEALLQRMETLELNQKNLTIRLEALQKENDALRRQLEGRAEA